MTGSISPQDVINAVLAGARDPRLDELGWTDAIFHQLADLASQRGCTSYPSLEGRTATGRKFGEYLWDFTITTWPDYQPTGWSYPDYFDSAASGGPLTVELACECEWGDHSARAKTGLAVMEDFCKLLPCRAPVKLMVFGYHEERGKTEASFGRLSSLMKALIARSGDDAGYVLFGLAWRSRRYSTSIRSDGAWLDVVDHPLWLGEDFTPNP